MEHNLYKMERGTHRGITFLWDNIHSCYSFTFRGDSGRNERYGAPTIEATKTLIDQLYEHRTPTIHRPAENEERGHD